MTDASMPLAVSHWDASGTVCLMTKGSRGPYWFTPALERMPIFDDWYFLAESGAIGTLDLAVVTRADAMAHRDLAEGDFLGFTIWTRGGAGFS